MTAAEQVVRRVGGRVLVLDRSDHMLLMCGFDPAYPDVRYWFTPGGGIENDESTRQGAVRELYEETGLEVEEESLGALIHHQEVDIPFDGVVYRQAQDFYLYRTARFEPMLTALDPDERRSVTGHRWWSPEELGSSGEIFYPENLLEIVAAAREGSPLE